MTLTTQQWLDAWTRLIANEVGKPREAFIPAFRQKLNANPVLYYLFEKFALEAVAAGFDHFSADLVFQRMRWYTDIEARGRADTAGDEWRLNNNFRTLLARLFILIHPEHSKLFELREKQKDDTP
jgi:hypothetical protein